MPNLIKETALTLGQVMFSDQKRLSRDEKLDRWAGQLESLTQARHKGAEVMIFAGFGKNLAARWGVRDVNMLNSSFPLAIPKGLELALNQIETLKPQFLVVETLSDDRRSMTQLVGWANKGVPNYSPIGQIPNLLVFRRD